MVKDINPDNNEGKSPNKLDEAEPNICPNNAADKPVKVSILAKPAAYIIILVLSDFPSLLLLLPTTLSLSVTLIFEEPKYANVNGSKLKEQGENEANKPAAYKNPNDKIVISLD